MKTIPVAHPRSRARSALAAFTLVAALLGACAEKKPLLPDPDQAGNYTGDAGEPPASAETADAAAP